MQISTYENNDPNSKSNVKVQGNQAATLSTKNPYIQGMQYLPISDPMAELDSCLGILIKQIPEIAEALSGCEMENIYHVFGSSTSGFKFLFKCKESSNWCVRRCCTSTRRGFNMDIGWIASGNPMDPIASEFAKADKSCSLGCCCLCRPEMVLSLQSNKQRVGRARYECTLCDPTFHIYDESDILRYIITGSCCQCGLMCTNNFCGKFSEVTFDIYNPNGNKSGKIMKQRASGAEYITDADSYEVVFPQDACAKDKILLTAVGHLIDYQYFELDANDDEEKKKDKAVNTATRAAMGGGMRV